MSFNRSSDRGTDRERGTSLDISGERSENVTELHIASASIAESR